MGTRGRIDSAGTIAAPLLAAHDHADRVRDREREEVRWPDTALLLLVTATVLLLASVQCANSARRYAVGGPSELEAWWPDLRTDPHRLEMVRREQWGHSELYLLWVRRFVRTLNVGILFVIAGLAVVLLPPCVVDGKPVDIATTRYVAVGIATAGVLLEALWIVAIWGVGGTVRAERAPMEHQPGKVSSWLRQTIFGIRMTRGPAEWLVAPYYEVIPPELSPAVLDNTSTVVQAIRERPGISPAELAVATGLAPSVIERCIEQLRQDRSIRTVNGASATSRWRTTPESAGRAGHRTDALAALGAACRSAGA